jgi:hypothetical protein
MAHRFMKEIAASVLVTGSLIAPGSAKGQPRPSTLPAALLKPVEPARRERALQYLKSADAAMAGSEARDISTMNLCLVQARLGDVAGALRRNNAEKSPLFKVATLAEVARIEFASGDVAGAKATIGRAATLAAKPGDLDEVGQVETDIGDITSASAIAARMDAPVDKSKLLDAIGCARFKLGDREAAQRDINNACSTLESSPSSPQAGPWTFGMIAIDQADAGDFDGAAKTLDRDTDKSDVVSARAVIAVSRAVAAHGNKRDAEQRLAEWQQLVGAPDQTGAEGLAFADMLGIADQWKKLNDLAQVV